MADEAVPGSVFSQTSQGHACHILEQLNVQRYYGAFCDIVVRVEDCDFRVHKCVLAAASSRLQTMVYGLDCNSVLALKLLTVEGFKAVAEFIYTGFLKLECGTVNEVLLAAQSLEIREVEKCCLDYLKNLKECAAAADTKTISSGSGAGRTNGGGGSNSGSCSGGGGVNLGPVLPMIPPPLLNMAMASSFPQAAPLPPPPPRQDDEQVAHGESQSSHGAPSSPLTPPPMPPSLPHPPASSSSSSSSASVAQAPVGMPPPQMPLPPLPDALPGPHPGMVANGPIDPNYLEDYLKIIESIQGEPPPPPPPLPPLGMVGSHLPYPMVPPLPPHIASSMLAPPPLPPPSLCVAGKMPESSSSSSSSSSARVSYPTVSFNATTAPHGLHSGPMFSKDYHQTVSQLASLEGGQTQVTHGSANQSSASAGVSSKSGPSTASHTATTNSYLHSSSTTNPMSQYSAEEVRRTVLNVLSRFDDDEDDEDESTSVAKTSKKEATSLTWLLNLAPLKPREEEESSKTPSEFDISDSPAIQPISSDSEGGDDHAVQLVGDKEPEVLSFWDKSCSDPGTRGAYPSATGQDFNELVAGDKSPVGLNEDRSPLKQKRKNKTPKKMVNVEQSAPKGVPKKRNLQSFANLDAGVGCGSGEFPPVGIATENPIISVPVSQKSSCGTSTSLVTMECAQKRESLTDPLTLDHGIHKHELPSLVDHCLVDQEDRRDLGLPHNFNEIQCIERVQTFEKPEDGEFVDLEMGNLVIDTEFTESSMVTDPGSLNKPLKKRIKIRMKKKVACETCGREFGRPETLDKHLQLHEKRELHSCHICGQNYSRMSELTRHLRFHSPDTFKCRACEAEYSDPKLFKQHMETMHAEKKAFRCAFPDCLFASKKLCNVEKHAAIHSDTKTYNCPHCNKRFSQTNGLRSHIKSCLELRGYLCDLCGAKFNYLQSMKYHRLLHSGERPFQCVDCGARFSDPRNLKRHRRIHDNKFPYECLQCGKTFRHSNSLKNHTNTHTNPE